MTPGNRSLSSGSRPRSYGMWRLVNRFTPSFADETILQYVSAGGTVASRNSSRPLGVICSSSPAILEKLSLQSAEKEWIQESLQPEPPRAVLLRPYRDFQLISKGSDQIQRLGKEVSNNLEASGICIA